MRTLWTIPLGASCLLLDAAARAGPPAPDPRPVPTQEARLHIETDAVVTLRRRVGRFGEVVCAAPCDRIVRFDPGDRFVVEGRFPEPAAFTLDAAGAAALVRVQPGHRGALWGGFAAVALGGSTLVGLGLVYVLTLLGGDPSPGVKRGLLGGAIGAAGLVAIGVPLLVVSPTRVEVLPDPRRTRARAPFTFQF